MQQRENNDILKDLTAAKKRIDKQKAELTKELNRLEAEKAATEQGKQPSGEAFSLNAIFNSNPTAEELARKIAGIKAALDLPYYADSEYRRLSIAYLEAVTEAEAADLEKNEREVEAAVKAIDAAKEHLEQLRKNREDIAAAASDKVASVGLSAVSYDMMDYTPAYVLKKYKETCDKYN